MNHAPSMRNLPASGPAKRRNPQGELEINLRNLPKSRMVRNPNIAHRASGISLNCGSSGGVSLNRSPVLQRLPVEESAKSRKFAERPGDISTQSTAESRGRNSKLLPRLCGGVAYFRQIERCRAESHPLDAMQNRPGGVPRIAGLYDFAQISKRCRPQNHEVRTPAPCNWAFTEFRQTGQTFRESHPFGAEPFGRRGREPPIFPTESRWAYLYAIDHRIMGGRNPHHPRPSIWVSR